MKQIELKEEYTKLASSLEKEIEKETNKYKLAYLKGKLSICTSVVQDIDTIYTEIR